MKVDNGQKHDDVTIFCVRRAREPIVESIFLCEPFPTRESVFVITLNMDGFAFIFQCGRLRLMDDLLDLPTY